MSKWTLNVDEHIDELAAMTYIRLQIRWGDQRSLGVAIPETASVEEVAANLIALADRLRSAPLTPPANNTTKD